MALLTKTVINIVIVVGAHTTTLCMIFQPIKAVNVNIYTFGDRFGNLLLKETRLIQIQLFSPPKQHINY